jgi:hypothetical protein
MVAVRSNKEMELTPALTPIAPYKSQTARWKRDIIPPIAGMTPVEGHMAIHIRRRELILGGAVVALPLKRGSRACSSSSKPRSWDPR